MRAKRPLFLIAVMAPLLVLQAPGEVGAGPLAFNVDSGSTIQFEGEPSQSLSGSLQILCRPDSFGRCPSLDEVTFDITALEIQATGIALSGQGDFVAVENESGIGFSIGRELLLSDVGVLSIPPPRREAFLSYGFDAALVGSFPDFDRYVFWSLATPMGSTSSWSGIDPFPQILLLELRLTENFVDLGPLGIVDMSAGRIADVQLSATQVPEPSPLHTLFLGICALALPSALRRRARIVARPAVASDRPMRGRSGVVGPRGMLSSLHSSEAGS